MPKISNKNIGWGAVAIGSALAMREIPNPEPWEIVLTACVLGFAILMLCWDWGFSGKSPVEKVFRPLFLAVVCISISVGWSLYCWPHRLSTEGRLVPIPTGRPMPGTDLEIGPGGTQLQWLVSDLGEPQIGFFYDAGLRIASASDGPVVSTPVRDREGHLVAEINNNVWRIYPEFSSDWNYDQHALEVKDSGGHVVLQIRLYQDRVQLQGEWHDQFGRGGRLMKNEDGPNSSFSMWPNAQREDTFKALIVPMFKYPGKAHLGELVKP